MTTRATAEQTRIRPWLFVWLCFATLAVVMSARQSVAIMTDEWVRALEWSRSFIGSGQAVAMLVMGIAGPVTGNLADQMDQGPYGGWAPCRGIGTSAFRDVSIGIGLYCGLRSDRWRGFGAVRSHLVSTAIAKSFTVRRGLALGVANAGTSAGQFFTVPSPDNHAGLLLLALEYRGGRLHMRDHGGFPLVLASGELPTLQREDSPTQELKAPLGDRLKFLLSNSTFHILFWSFFVCGVTSTGVMETHFLPDASFCGFRPVPASGIYGLIMAINLGGMVMAGYLTDTVSRPLILFVIYAMRSVSFIVLLYTGTSYEMLLLFALPFGIFDYSTVPPTASLLRRISASR